MPDRGHHDEVLTEVFIDRFRFGGRFDYDEILWHCYSIPVTHRCLFVERGLLRNQFPEVFRSGNENNTKYALNAKHPLFDCWRAYPQECMMGPPKISFQG